MRWVQRWNEELGKHEFIPRDEAAMACDGVAIHGDITPFVSPVDGSIISDRKKLREHNKRNNVVNAAEFSDECIAQKRAERERIFKGEHTREEKLARKQELWEIITRAERNGHV